MAENTPATQTVLIPGTSCGFGGALFDVCTQGEWSSIRCHVVRQGWYGAGTGTSSAGLPSKNPLGLRWKPM